MLEDPQQQLPPRLEETSHDQSSSSCCMILCDDHDEDDDMMIVDDDKDSVVKDGGKLSYVHEAIKKARKIHEKDFPPCSLQDSLLAPDHGGDLNNSLLTSSSISSHHSNNKSSSSSSKGGGEQQQGAKTIPTFRMREIVMNKLLGAGAFGTVYEITGFVTSTWNVFTSSTAPAGAAQQQQQPPRRNSKLNDHLQSLFFSKGSSKDFSRKSLDDEDEMAQDNFESRRFIAEHCIRKGGDARYAIKLLSAETLADKDLLTQGICDMATETKILSRIEHPNIVKLRATAPGTVFRPDYFLILDRLYDTLQTKCKTWCQRQQKYARHRRSFFRSTKRVKTKEDDLYEERIHAAFDLSAAVAYLHSKRILHRDIKPQNIGFDIRGDIKIFDFGFAKQLPPALEEGNHRHRGEDDGRKKKEDLIDENGLYKNMTGMCGSPRYMAPEVALKQNYNEKCDVYSFALVFWEILSLNKAFPRETFASLSSDVWNKQVSKRPQVNELWSLQMKLLLRRSWSHTIQERPTMQAIETMLRRECVQCRNGDETGLEHLERRSTFVFEKQQSESGIVGSSTTQQGGARAAVGGGPPRSLHPLKKLDRRMVTM